MYLLMLPNVSHKKVFTLSREVEQCKPLPALLRTADLGGSGSPPMV